MAGAGSYHDPHAGKINIKRSLVGQSFQNKPVTAGTPLAT